ncbi:MAG: LuxR family transcriptional regulator [Synechococcales cyanobacterium M58_A2018_015]|nr:LuxR family transcriptional regulator [Synechococcales cyanobacterium M58_A2018_015]
MNTVAFPNRPPSNRPLAPQFTPSLTHYGCQDLNEDELQNSKVLSLLQAVLESWVDGIMILTDTGELVLANSCASRICDQLTQNLSRVPQQIWRCCQALIENQSKFIEDEIRTEDFGAIRVRASWLESNSGRQPHLFVALEDQHQTAEYRAKAEARRYGLTDRETQVWLLRRAGCTYKEIAAELFIAEDTVKKHIKSIHAKRDANEWLKK